MRSTEERRGATLNARGERSVPPRSGHSHAYGRGDENRARETREQPARKRLDAVPRMWGPALVLLGSQAEPEREGEVLLCEGKGTFVFGRFDPDLKSSSVLRPVRQRPGSNEVRPPLELADYVSRKQLRLSIGRDRDLLLTVTGKAPVWVDDGPELAPGHEVSLRLGSTLRIGDDLCFLVTTRPRRLPELRASVEVDFPFGAADGNGMIGESPVMWALRERLAFVAAIGLHALVIGESGTGKELAARAIHRLSPRGDRPIVAHSAADIPATLIEAELFGNRADYPQSGMPAREGLIGSAHGSSLFLDELGTLPSELQSRLLRVLDSHGEYRRLGLDTPRRSDFRLIAATNQSPDRIKHDLRARLQHTVELPPLTERSEDVPLLIHALLSRMVERPGDRVMLARFQDPQRFRISLDLIQALTRHQYQTHIRELQQLLLISIYESKGDTLERTPTLDGRLRFREATAAPEMLGEAELRAALQQAGWNVLLTARRLGLSRFQLMRQMKKLGIVRPD